MLNFLSSGNQKQIVGISLTPGIGIEAIILDKKRNAVLNYGTKKVEYNFSTREIQDYVQFKTALVELMDEMKILPKSYVYIILPNVYFDFTEIPPSLSDNETKTILLSQAEEFYIFKREEPVSGWAEVYNPEGKSQKRIAFTSFQRSCVDELKEIISDIGLQIAGIESSYSATLRGLYVTGLMDDMVKEDAPWTAMLINTNSYTFFQMDGKKFIDYNDVPLAIKSFSTEEAYQAIVSSSAQLLNSSTSQRLYIISQTDDICAEVLKNQMQYDREIIAIDSNKYSKKPLLEVVETNDIEHMNSMTLSAIGAANIKTDLNLTLNVLADDPDASLGIYFTANILGNTVDVTSEVVQKASIVLCVLFAIIFGALCAFFAIFDKTAQKTVTKLNEQISIYDAQIKKDTDGESGHEVNMLQIIDEIANQTVTAIRYYDSIATDIPKNVWLTKYYNKTGDKIAIQGIAANITDIYEYYKNLRIVSPKTDIKLTELKVVTDDAASDNQTEKPNSTITVDSQNRLYSFEIANTTIATQNTDNNNQNNQNQQNQKNENDIIVRPIQQAPVEQPSEQMKPAK